MWAVVTGVVAVLAFALSLFNLIEGWWRRRTASLTARLESHIPPPSGGDRHEAWLSGAQFERIVLTNHGPAVATHVEMDLDDAGRIHREGAYLFPVPLLHPGEEVHDELSRATDEYPPQSVTLRWRDKRRGAQERQVYLSMQKLV